MTASTNTRPTDTGASQLARRRAKLQARNLEAEMAGQKLAQHAEALESTSSRVSQLEADIKATEDRLAALKKSLKNARKQRVKLRGSRKKVHQNSAKAVQRAASAERKYDTSMLADILEREKQLDLARHADGATPAAPKARASATEARTAPSTSVAAVKPTPAKPTVATPAETPLHEGPSALTPPPAATATPRTRQSGTQARAPRRAAATPATPATRTTRTAATRTAATGTGTRGTRG